MTEANPKPTPMRKGITGFWLFKMSRLIKASKKQKAVISEM
jgi:hypothetical protein